MMKKIIITSEAFSKHQCILKLPTLKPIFHNFDVPIYGPTPEITPTDLPFETVLTIIDFCVDMQIKQGAIRDALSTLCVSRHFLIYFYDKFYASHHNRNLKDYPKVSQIYKRLSRTFLIAETFRETVAHDPIRATFFEDDISLVIALEHTSRKRIFVYPWQFNDMTVTPINNPIIYDHIRFKTIEMAPEYGQTAWINGFTHNGITTTTMFKSPIIILDFHDLRGSLFEHDMTLLRPWRGLGNFLRFCFGPDTGVFVIANPRSLDHEHVFYENVVVEI